MSGITIIDYGLGNVQAFAHIYKRLNIPVQIAKTVSELSSAQKLILPGVGAFDWAMKRLNQSGLRDTLDHLVLEQQVPILGVCVGMQMMATRSDEGQLAGLGWLNAEVMRFDFSQTAFAPLPHMGWNDIQPASEHIIFNGIASPRYYFLHSYIVVPKAKEHVIAHATYGSEFTAAVAKNNVIGTQFHPEKSHQWGIDLLNNFARF